MLVLKRIALLSALLLCAGCATSNKLPPVKYAASLTASGDSP